MVAELNYIADPKGLFTFPDPCATEFMANILACTGGSGSGGGGESGTGSPEGVVTAEPGTTYWDSVGQEFWVKSTGSGNTGWVSLVTL